MKLAVIVNPRSSYNNWVKLNENIGLTLTKSFRFNKVWYVDCLDRTYKNRIELIFLGIHIESSGSEKRLGYECDSCIINAEGACCALLPIIKLGAVQPSKKCILPHTYNFVLRR